MVKKRDRIKDLDLRRNSPEQKLLKSIGIDELSAYGGQTSPSDFQDSIWDGGKFSGGFGPTQIFQEDYWTLRARSAQLFTENMYAAGLIRRLITSEIGPGLMPEATPYEQVIGVPEDSLTDWAELVEMRFALWTGDKNVCDHKKKLTWGGLNRVARAEALISGDCLVVLLENPETKRPCVQLINGAAVDTPWAGDAPKPKKGHTISYGVELDPDGREVAFHVRQTDGKFKRVAAFGPKSGRAQAWLVYGSEQRIGKTRGVPLLTLVMQSLKEIDRYRDSTQRKAVINSILAMFIKKTQDKMSTLPISGGAVRRDSVDINDSDGKTRKFNIATQIPGLVIEELQVGEEPVLKGGEGTDVNFPPFEEAILRAIAWSNQIPPEILLLSFSSNYSASQAANNEFTIYLELVWKYWGETFCAPIYKDWFISEVLLQTIKADGFLEAWRDPMRYDVAGAWVFTEWCGNIKPSTDIVKQAKGAQILVAEGWSTNARVSRNINGTKWSQNIKRLKRENELKAEAMRPMLELRKEYGPDTVETSARAIDDAVLQFVDFMGDKAS